MVGCVVVLFGGGWCRGGWAGRAHVGLVLGADWMRNLGSVVLE